MSAEPSAVGRIGAGVGSVAPRAQSGDTPLWRGVRGLVCRVPSDADVRAHGLEPLVVAYWPSVGRPVTPDIARRARAGAGAVLAAPLVLARVRAACDGPIVLLKGPAVCACYPSPAMRPFTDLDLLVPDPHAVHRRLVAAGFVPVGDPARYVGIHHLRPLQLGTLPLTVEIHARPKWVEHAAPPPLQDLLDSAVPSAAVPVDGILSLPAAEHAVILAAHSWAHTPLGALRQLIDIAAVRDEARGDEIDVVARRWHVERLWRATSRALDALLLDEAASWPLRTWARNLPRARDRTVLETHLERWLAPFAVETGRRALPAAVVAMRDDLRRGRDDDWQRKLRRTRLAVKNALVRSSQHEAEIRAGDDDA